MAFIEKNEDTAANNKQHLNLSTLAYEVISSDMFAFGEEKRSGFINRIFSHFYPDAEASIARTMNHLNGELSKLLSDVSGDDKTKKRIVDRLLSQKEDELIKKAESYDKGKLFKFWLNKSNLEYLTEISSECSEDKYYTKRGKYIKSVIEEYARLPYVERERVYFRPFIDTIRYSIKEERQLRIVTGSDIIYSVYPYEILCDPLSTANYLVGYCRQYDCPEGEKIPCSFRISALKSIKVEKSKSAFLKESDKKKLSELISIRGVQFMIGNESKIHVRFTENGINKYHRQSHLRPRLIEKTDEKTYIFQCTAAQAEFYFFKFGKDVEILSPPDLRQKFKMMYGDAAKIYN